MVISDEERAREIAEHAGIDMLDDHNLFIAEMSAALAQARAEEAETCAKIAENYEGSYSIGYRGILEPEGPWSVTKNVAAAIRALRIDRRDA